MGHLFVFVALALGQEVPVTAPLTTPGFLQKETDVFGWAQKAISSVDTSNPSKWPPLSRGQWDIGLNHPRIYVLSLESSLYRRERFAFSYLKLGISAEVQWIPAVNGSSVPAALRDEQWTAGGSDILGVLGCFLSHVAILEKHIAECPSCDLVVLEDDIAFHPEFKDRWSKFVEAIPEQVDVDGTLRDVGILHFGGDAFWEPPWSKEPNFYVAAAASRTWGYAIKAKKLRDINEVLKSIGKDSFIGIDILLAMVGDHTFFANADFATLVPEDPLVKAWDDASFIVKNGITGNDDLRDDQAWLWKDHKDNCWHYFTRPERGFAADSDNCTMHHIGSEM